TERKRAEEALRESEERFRTIFNGALDGIILVDAMNRKCVMGNRTVLAMLGYTEDELKTLRPDDIHPADAMPRVTKHLEETMRGDISVVEEMPVKRKDGTLYYADISASIVTLDGRPHFLGVFRDVTERKRASEEQQKLVSIIETSEDFIGIADLDGRALYVNAAGRKLVGLDGIDAVRNRPVAEFHQEADRGKFESEVLSTIRERGHWRGEVAFRHFKTGELIPVEMYGFVIKDSRTGQPIALATISRDIADRKHAEEERQKLQTQLLQSQKMESIGQLAGGIAHDFNNILAAIVGYGNLLQMQMRDDDPARVQVDQILASAERATSLTQSLLAFSRKQVISPKNIDLNASIRKIERLLSRIIGEDIMLKTSLSADALTVYADPTQIEQVLMNLATNARDAMPKGGTLMIGTERVVFDDRRVKAQGYGTPGTFVAMIVSDTGIGMDEKTREKIFDPFFTTKELGRGTGLGLSIVYGIVKQNKGDINVVSEVGKGTTITIFLPLVSAGLEEGRRPEITEPIRGGTETILLAEDNEDVRSLTKQVLADFG
ncbi:MAG: PAS domain S-box protein, partial [Syntrophaceae bacterium]|nr:PAS domain S-box protein [Syntrophaceae bacterium]